MGIFLSKRHDHGRSHQHHHRPPPPPPSSSSNPPPSPPPVLQSPRPPTYAFAANAPLPIEQPYFPVIHPRPEQPSFAPIPPRPLPTPAVPNNNYNYNFWNYYSRPVNVPGQYSNYRPYYNAPPQVSEWGPPAAPAPPPPWPQQPVLQPAPYVDHQNAKKIKNDVNVHKDTIRVQLDEENRDCHLVSFTFDAMIDGSITIFYFAKEGPNCNFTPVYPEIVPVKIPFKKGLGQKFVQPSGTGVDLGFFDIDDLSKPIPEDDVYPLVISAGASEPSASMDEHSNEKLVNLSSHAQISQAVLEKKDDENFKAKVLKQILWIDGVRYELREIFGINNSDETTFNDVDAGKECVICMTEVKNTAVLPCRHMCMCSECAKELRLQSDKCPVCRQPIEELLEIKVDEEESKI